MNLRALFLFALMAALLVGATIHPASAQSAPVARPLQQVDEARAAELRQWFESQTPQRQELLKRRLRAIKRLPKDTQAALIRNVADGKAMLTEKQRENLEQVRRMPYLQRVRLYTVSRELDMLRRANPAAFKRANERPDRARALSEMLLVHRAQMALTPAEREQIKGLKPDERMRFMRDKLAQNGRERMERITFLEPRIADLRKAAAAGDEAARNELREAMADLGTLDMLLQRLTPDRQQKVMEELRGLGLEKAVETVRKELKNQWSEQEKKRPRDEKDRPGPDNGMRPAERRALAPKEDRSREK